MTVPVANRDKDGNMVTKTLSTFVIDGPIDKDKIKVDI